MGGRDLRVRRFWASSVGAWIAGTPERRRRAMTISQNQAPFAVPAVALPVTSAKPGASGQKPVPVIKLTTNRGAFPMPIIDSQVHAYEANTPKRPWHNVPNWPPHVTGDEMVAAMDKVGVDGAIFISAFSMYRYDASY